MRRRNLTTALPRRACRDPMRAYDALPEGLRHWLATARLPWSAGSARRIWARARAEGRDPAEALARAEARCLARDAALVWGAGYPDGAEGVERQRRTRPSN